MGKKPEINGTTLDLLASIIHDVLKPLSNLLYLDHPNNETIRAHYDTAYNIGLSYMTILSSERYANLSIGTTKSGVALIKTLFPEVDVSYQSDSDTYIPAMPIYMIVNILCNLISNSKEHNTGANDLHIKACITEDKGNLIIDYEDNGLGMYSQVTDNLHTTTDQHSIAFSLLKGRGLVAIHNVVSWYNGTITSSSDTMANGNFKAAFTIKIPRSIK